MITKQFQFIEFERKGKICIIKLNRPEKKNALSEALRSEIIEALDLLKEDKKIKSVIFYGGEQFFSAGFDKDEVQTALNDAKKIQQLKQSTPLFHKKIFEFPKLTIAAINGYALGGGFDLTVLCHLRVASKNAIFGHPEIRFGACPLFFSYMTLVGRGKALEIVLNTADPENFFNADEAYRLNIVNKLVESGTVLNEAINIAKKILLSPDIVITQLLRVNNALFDQYKAYEKELNTIEETIKILSVV